MQHTEHELSYSILLIEGDEAQQRAIGTLINDFISRQSTPAKSLAANPAKSLAANSAESSANQTTSLDIVRNLEEAHQQIAATGPAIILADMESVCGIQGVEALTSVAPHAKLISLSGLGALSSAIDAMRAGAWDFLIKPVGKSTLQKRIGEALASYHKDLKRRLKAKQKKVALLESISPATAATKPAKTQEASELAFEGFCGRSAAMLELYQQIDRVAPSAAPVFITGESGTGKDVCAEALHARSGRGDKPFVALNCSAIPKDLMESELFGHCKGAFTGAVADHPGAAEQADGGTLFLDEIGDMDMALQAKLLRFLQTGTVRRIGDVQMRSVNVRIICATHRDPYKAVADRRFREDLFYRLHVLPIFVPPLRVRKEDVLVLANRFLQSYVREEGRAFTNFSSQSEACLKHYHWPGNVRELQNVVRHTIVMNDGQAVEAHMLPDSMRSSSIVAEALDAGIKTTIAEARVKDPFEGRSKGHDCLPFWQQEQSIIEAAVTRYDGNISRAAAALEISPSTIYRKRQSWLSQSV
ncbi:MAG: sigma-54-dependent transcriptional regulator [Alphaproteobacteria bacterium]